MRSVAVLLVGALVCAVGVPAVPTSTNVDTSRQGLMTPITKNAVPPQKRKQRDNKQPAGYSAPIGVKPRSLRTDLIAYPIFATNANEAPAAMKTFIDKLKRASALAPFVEFLQTFWNWIEASADEPTGVSVDFTMAIGANSGRTVTFGVQTIAKLASAPVRGTPDADDAGRRLNGLIEQLAVDTGVLATLASIRDCAVGSYWRMERSYGEAKKGDPSSWCWTGWPVLIKAVHTYMVDNGLYAWRNVARRLCGWWNLREVLVPIDLSKSESCKFLGGGGQTYPLPPQRRTGPAMAGQLFVRGAAVRWRYTACDTYPHTRTPCVRVCVVCVCGCVRVSVFDAGSFSRKSTPALSRAA